MTPVEEPVLPAFGCSARERSTPVAGVPVVPAAPWALASDVPPVPPGAAPGVLPGALEEPAVPGAPVPPPAAPAAPGPPPEPEPAPAPAPAPAPLANAPPTIARTMN